MKFKFYFDNEATCVFDLTNIDSMEQLKSIIRSDAQEGVTWRGIGSDVIINVDKVWMISTEREEIK